MIELIVLWRLCVSIGSTVREKGRRRWPWVLLTVALWFGGELTGAVVGAAIWPSGGDAPGIVVYLSALAGAVAGYGVAHVVATTLAPAAAAPDRNRTAGVPTAPGIAVQTRSALQPLAGLARWLEVLLRANIGLALLAVFLTVFAWAQRVSFEPGSEGATPSTPEVLVVIGGIVVVPFGLFTAFTYFRWVYRATKNLRVFSGQTSFRPGWAVGWYFVPIASLWMPYVVMSGIWAGAGGASNRTRNVVGWWWCAWLLSVYFIDTAAALAVLLGFGLESYATVDAASTVKTLFDVVLGLLTLRLVSSTAAAYNLSYPEPGAAGLRGEPEVVADVTGPGIAPA